MAKDNLFLGFGRGKVGDVVFSRVGGQQVARARNRAPRNPRTTLQLAQRSIIKTAAGGYSLLKEICDHSFQGVEAGSLSQQRFMKLNVEYLRSKASAFLAAPDNLEDADVTNYASASSTLPEINSYIVSEGKLPSVTPMITASGFLIPCPAGSLTYAQVVAHLGLQRGDQLTFLMLSSDDSVDNGNFNGFRFARVILEPSDGDMSSPFISGSAINKPNAKNEGSVSFTLVNSDMPGEDSAVSGFRFLAAGLSSAAGSANLQAAAAVIVSREVGGVWARSSSRLIVRSSVTTDVGHFEWDHETDLLSDAIYSFQRESGSTLYLNQAKG